MPGVRYKAAMRIGLTFGLFSIIKPITKIPIDVRTYVQNPVFNNSEVASLQI